jgi:3-hydroxyisobutyrate dehydrogenase
VGETIGVLGAGTMGAPIARNLAKAGFAVRVWNRTRAAAEGIEGVTVADTPAAAVSGADFMLTMLTDGRVVAEVAGDALDGADDRTIWIQASTVGIEATERLEQIAVNRGIPFVDAPVSGTKEPAEQGELTVLASGPEELRERCEPVFEAIARKAVWLGPAGAGTRMKLVLNCWLVALVEGLAETLALARGLDLDPALFLETIAGGPLDLPYAQLKGKLMLAEEFPESFRLRLAAKDARLVVEAAVRAGLDLPLAETIAERLERGVQLGYGDEDLAATYRTSVRSSSPAPRGSRRS